jgi:aspartate aminotransferase/aminotransferase
VTATLDEVRGIAELCLEKGVALLSDEIYSPFHFGSEMVSPAKFNPQTIVIDGFSKSYAMTGWRLGYVHGPREIIQTMIKLQQYTFVCAPTPLQHASLAAMDYDMTAFYKNYESKRDRIVEGLRGYYEFVEPGGAFYIFPKVPSGPSGKGACTGSEFVAKAIANELLVIPGNIFSKRDTHFRISFAASDQTLDRGIEVLRKLARG